jgi:hypothetical protein
VEEGQSREEALAEAFCWSLGVDGTYGWHEELLNAESLRRPVEDWPDSVASGPAGGRRSAPWCCTVRLRWRPAARRGRRPVRKQEEGETFGALPPSCILRLLR